MVKVTIQTTKVGLVIAETRSEQEDLQFLTEDGHIRYINLYSPTSGSKEKKTYKNGEKAAKKHCIAYN